MQVQLDLWLLYTRNVYLARTQKYSLEGRGLTWKFLLGQLYHHHRRHRYHHHQQQHHDKHSRLANLILHIFRATILHIYIKFNTNIFIFVH